MVCHGAQWNAMKCRGDAKAFDGTVVMVLLCSPRGNAVAVSWRFAGSHSRSWESMTNHGLAQGCANSRGHSRQCHDEAVGFHVTTMYCQGIFCNGNDHGMGMNMSHSTTMGGLHGLARVCDRRFVALLAQTLTLTLTPSPGSSS